MDRIASDGTPALLNTEQASHYTGIPIRTIGRLVASDAIPSTTIGRSRLFPRAALELWVAHGCPDKPGDGERILHELRTRMMTIAGLSVARNSCSTPAKAQWVSGGPRRGRA
ncbi:MAG: helix-turn-helix domain-containing protein [Phycisphaerales bacterium]|nr:helix-turn-helix domain-containing protein [Phycisphaerales bacterium]